MTPSVTESELTVIITICTLLLIAYLFDFTSSRTKIPSAILLLLLGWIVRQITIFFNLDLPDLSPALSVLGTIGLILIVLEGSLELELSRTKLGVINKSLFGSLVSLLALAGSLMYLFSWFGNFSLRESLVNAIPFCVISSSIAIPSARSLPASSREFIIYESSFSDIIGVLLFNLVALNEVFNAYLLGHFGFQLLSITVVSLMATIGLSVLLSKIEHHIKFVPIILLVILIYAVSKAYHLPALLFILLFGLFIGNLDKLNRFKWMEKLNPGGLNAEVKKFKELTVEATFLIRALFFLLFGYSIETSDIVNGETLAWAAVIVCAVFIFRAIQLKISGLPLRPLLFIAPRGLITILLFLSIPEVQRISLVNKSLIIQVILLTAVLMIIGMIGGKKPGEPAA